MHHDVIRYGLALSGELAGFEGGSVSGFRLWHGGDGRALCAPTWAVQWVDMHQHGRYDGLCAPTWWAAAACGHMASKHDGGRMVHPESGG